MPADQIATLWARGVDISRSLWDAKHLVFMLELDYLNVDQPAEPFLRPAEVFVKLEPAYRATRREFRQLGLAPRTVMTGRGYQFAGAVPLDHPVIPRLAALSRLPFWFAGVDRRRPPGVTAPLTIQQARSGRRSRQARGVRGARVCWRARCGRAPCRSCSTGRSSDPGSSAASVCRSTSLTSAIRSTSGSCGCRSARINGTGSGRTSSACRRRACRRSPRFLADVNRC